MYLRRLEVVGFKSFADAFELELQKGISCIVGPNGCGKSNVADALRWVLGSQSPTELRADRMEDVIFSGTTERKPLGMAEVILTFDNSDRKLPLEFDQVTVTRRLFRSGDSEYLVNGSKCRLMDVTDLIVDRGLGSNGYWILEAGMVKAIIESKPTERRALFDEAAGIVKYKIQRHRAELKLDAAGADLDRLDDIISEVERGVVSLDRQVRSFRRWKAAEDRAAELQGLLAFRELSSSRERLTVLEKSLRESLGAEQECSAAVSTSSARQAGARAALEKAQAALDAEHEACAALDSSLGSVSERHAVASERRRSSMEQSESGERESASELHRAELIEEGLAGLQERTVLLGDRVEGAGTVLEAAREATAGLEGRHSASAALLERTRMEYREASARLSSLQERHGSQLRASEHAGLELERSSARLAELRQALSSLEASITEGIGRRDSCELSATEAASALAAGLEVLSARTSDLEEASARAASLETGRQLLEAREAQLAGALSMDSGPGAKLSDLVSVRDGMGLSVGAWLDAFQGAIAVDPDGLPESSDGSRYLARTSAAPRPELPEGAEWLPDCLLEGTDPRMTALLSGCIVAPDRDRAVQWFLGGFPLDIVTRSGDLFRADGLVRLGVSETAAGAVELRAMAGEAAREADALRLRLSAAVTSRDELRSRRTATATAVEELREKAALLARESASLAATVEAVESRRAEIEADITALTARMPELEKAAGEQTGDISGELRAARDDLEDRSAALEKLEKAHAELGEGLNRAVRLENESAMMVASAQAELTQTRREVERSAVDAAAARERSAVLAARASELKRLCSDMDMTLADLQEQRSGLISSREEAERRRGAASADRAGWLEKTRQIDGELNDLRERLTQARETRAALSGEAETCRRRVEELEAAHQVLPEDGSRYWSLEIDELMQELARQRNLRENLGPVNMLAVAEHEEASRRLDFLVTQRTDLMEARSSLLQAIEEINRTAARKFSETFGEVRKNFQEMFSRLFGGGEADIAALEAEDPLEGGVHIVARPPGKKMENVAALSSGERAMTAVALLFALYLVKPSPFCVLDELDAPLDDSNVDHFLDLVRSFTARTQFIVITHNKRTMEAADRLFGITMAEKGVSVLTTVSLEAAREMVGQEAEVGG